MKSMVCTRNFIWVVVLLLTPSLLMAQLSVRHAPGRMIVRFNEGVAPKIEHRAKCGIFTNIPLLDNLNMQYGCTGMDPIFAGKNVSLPIYTIQLAENADLESVMTAYRNSGLFQYVEPDFIGYVQGSPATDSILPNDTHFGNQWSLHNDGSFWATPVKVDADIDMPQAWMIEQGDTNVVVGIVDTGCKLDHPDLNNRIWINKGEIPGNGIDDDGNTLVDDWRGWDYANDDNNPTDDYGHGTNVTGIIGCNGNNSEGYAGVDWHCKLMILKAINSDNWGYYSWWISAINYAVNNGANVLNLSIGGSDPSQGLNDAVVSAVQNGVTVVASMMNANNNVAYIPASIPGVIAVGSTDPDDTRSNPFFWSPTSGSCYGSHISVVAPGNYIYGLNNESNTNYDYYWGGTSQAAPHVSGLAALLKAQDHSRSAADIKNIIQKTAQDQVGDHTEDTPGWDQYYGYGRINAYAALTYHPSGINENTPLSFQLYPNPVSEVCTIEWNPFVIIPSGIKIYSLEGKLMYERILDQGFSGKVQIDIPGVAPGIYQVLLYGNEKYFVQKMVVIR
jgi:thermitase